MRRIIELTPAAPALGLAVDEALLRFAEGHGPTVRAWINEWAVVVGRSQIASEEADLAACATKNIPVLQRISGGGAVVHHRGNLNLSVVAAGWGQGHGVARTFDVLGGAVAAALRGMGLPVMHAGSDLLAADRRKIGGGAQARRRGVLWHTTLLIDRDTIPMASLLLAMRPGYRPSRVASRPTPTVTVTELLGRSPSIEQIAVEATAALAKALQEKPQAGALADEEAAWALRRAAALAENAP